jgi:hemolysin III
MRSWILKILESQPLSPIKPSMRGYLHVAGFVYTCVIGLMLCIFFTVKKYNHAVLLYLVVQLAQFGISSLYHIVEVNPRIRRVLRMLDHMAIFLLIAGTQTAVLLLTPKKFPVDVSFSIKSSWTIALIGIGKLAVTNTINDIFDIGFYIFHGVAVVFSFRIIRSFFFLDLLLTILGGVFYIAGGVILGLERPNPFPKIFGFHEVFHTCTLIANACFSIVILKSFFSCI